ncbi:MAG TPA: cytidine deaminase [Lachnospiraceae bacterium]|nr:cytidine deaminase [Lachnospiraceae bacterium]
MIKEDTIKQLINEALNARNHAYAPYSQFMVGAALITEDDSVYTGCNVENASYGATNCAERTAIFKAVSEGERLIKAIAIVGGVKDGDMTYAYPCGVCRQVLREFSNPGDLVIIVAKNQDDYKTYSLEELLPESFGPDFKSAK